MSSGGRYSHMVVIGRTTLDRNIFTQQRILGTRNGGIKFLGGTVQQTEGGAQCCEPELTTSCFDARRC